MSIFNNREIAIGIWFAALIVFAATKPAVRESFGHVVRAFTNRLILIPLGLMAAYIGAIVYGLYEAGLWDCAFQVIATTESS